MSMTVQAVLTKERSNAARDVRSSQVTTESPCLLLAQAAMTQTLQSNGLDRMTPSRIESLLCTSALTAHI